MRLPRHVSSWSLVVVAAIAAGAALRVWVYTSPISALEADEAVVGLMALRALDGDVPVFYWGGLYGGSQEALVAAAAFAVTGPQTLVLKLVALTAYALSAVLVWLVGRLTVGEPAARVGAALFWIWPPFLVWWSMKQRGFYGSGLAIGLGALLLAVRLRQRDSKRDAALLGFVLGLAVWATLQAMLIAAPALAWLAWRRRGAFRLAPYAVPGIVLGAAPWLAWNLRHGGNAVLPESVQGSESTYLERLGDLFTIVLPMWLALRAPFSHDWLLPPTIGVALLALALGAFVFLLVRGPSVLEPLLVVGAAFPFLYAASSFTYYVGEPRYLVFLAPVPALLLGYVLVRRGPILAALGLGAAFAVSLAGLVQLERQGRYLPTAPDVRIPASVEPAIAALEDNGVDRVLANYWIAYPITFETGERIVASPTGFWRYRPYRDLVRAEEQPGRVYVEGSATELRDRERLVREGYRRLTRGGFVIYVPRDGSNR